jgi:hypothetical protein
MQPSTVKSTDVSLIRRHAIKANGEFEVQLHSFLLSVLHEDDTSASFPWRSAPEARYTEGQVGCTLLRR